MEDKIMLMDFLALPEKEQLEVLDALVSANHQFQENERKFKTVVDAAKKYKDRPSSPFLLADLNAAIDDLKATP